MALDTYSPCPGGTGKKVKFCCNDLAGELQKIDRMLEGEQVQACLSHVDALLTKYPDRACLLSTRSLVLRATHQAEAAARAVEEFLQKHPNNPVALADAAILAAEEEGGEAAMRLLQRALTASGEALEMRVYMAMGEVAEALAIEGNILAVVALLDTQIALQPDDPRPREMLLELRQSMRVPLLMKDHRWAPETPENVPWKARYEEAVSASRELRWSVCEERLTRLAGEVGDEPIVWRALAAMRGWVADKEGAMDALHKYASLPVPLDDAVEAEALARLLLDDPLGDHEDVFTVTYAVNDVDQLQTALALSRQVEAVQVNPAELTEEDQPPPRAVYHLCDRAVPEAG
ncbi:MAG: hypothetical protein HUU20_28750, partial [Pirellulales bacterium]|nr:hypothetical protein [Pirellulales bacterium]